MNYELAQKLKDAGFPLKKYEDTLFANLSSEGSSPYTFETEDGLYVYPTLEELIEACGRDFRFLERLREPDEEGSFWAESDNHGVAGSTPSEAVANLWLKLNKK